MLQHAALLLQTFFCSPSGSCVRRHGNKPTIDPKSNLRAYDLFQNQHRSFYNLSAVQLVAEENLISMLECAGSFFCQPRSGSCSCLRAFLTFHGQFWHQESWCRFLFSWNRRRSALGASLWHVSQKLPWRRDPSCAQVQSPCLNSGTIWHNTQLPLTCPSDTTTKNRVDMVGQRTINHSRLRCYSRQQMTEWLVGASRNIRSCNLICSKASSGKSRQVQSIQKMQKGFDASNFGHLFWVGYGLVKHLGTLEMQNLTLMTTMKCIVTG